MWSSGARFSGSVARSSACERAPLCPAVMAHMESGEGLMAMLGLISEDGGGSVKYEMHHIQAGSHGDEEGLLVSREGDDAGVKAGDRVCLLAMTAQVCVHGASAHMYARHCCPALYRSMASGRSARAWKWRDIAPLRLRLLAMARGLLHGRLTAPLRCLRHRGRACRTTGTGCFVALLSRELDPHTHILSCLTTALLSGAAQLPRQASPGFDSRRRGHALPPINCPAMPFLPPCLLGPKC